jgi:hypothetical protein
LEIRLPIDEPQCLSRIVAVAYGRSKQRFDDPLFSSIVRRIPRSMSAPRIPQRFHQIREVSVLTLTSIYAINSMTTSSAPG